MTEQQLRRHAAVRAAHVRAERRLAPGEFEPPLRVDGCLHRFASQEGRVAASSPLLNAVLPPHSGVPCGTLGARLAERRLRRDHTGERVVEDLRAWRATDAAAPWGDCCAAGASRSTRSPDPWAGSVPAACRLTNVRRVCAWLLLCTLSALWAPALPQHVHAAPDHAHNEHQHGIAAHAHGHDHGREHEEEAHRAERSAEWPRLDACPPDAHAIDATLASATVTGSAPPDPCEVATTFTVVGPSCTAAASLHADVRVHGPPSLAPASLRAPPLATPA